MLALQHEKHNSRLPPVKQSNIERRINVIRQNLHTHCTWDDGKNTIEEMIAAAKRAGMDSLGISVHTQTPYSSVCCPDHKLADYLQEMQTLKEKYAKDGFCLYAGIEWDVLSDMPDILEKRADGLTNPGFWSFDYVIGSVHAIPVKRSSNPYSPVISKLFEKLGDRGYDYPTVDEDIKKVKYMVRDLFGGDGDAAAEHYFAQYQTIAENPFVNIVGHFDLIKKFCHMYRFYSDQEYHAIHPASRRYQDAARAALDLLLKSDKIIELNTSIMEEELPNDTMYPSLNHLEYIHEKGGRVTIGSDAHQAMHINHNFPIACTILKKVGFQEIWVLDTTENGIEFVPQRL